VAIRFIFGIRLSWLQNREKLLSHTVHGLHNDPIRTHIYGVRLPPRP
jgi:hypothetical protein